MVKGILSGNPQHHICRALELRVPLIIIPICWAHGVQVAYLDVIVEAEHIGREQEGFSNWINLSLSSSSSSYRGLIVAVGEQRNHGLKYESDCVRIGIGIKIFMNCGRFCERLFR